MLHFAAEDTENGRTLTGKTLKEEAQMTVRNRILIIRLTDKIHEQPEYAKKIGINAVLKQQGRSAEETKPSANGCHAERV